MRDDLEADKKAWRARRVLIGGSERAPESFGTNGICDITKINRLRDTPIDMLYTMLDSLDDGSIKGVDFHW
jgi:hypothetical protein